jgi:aminoglycoside 6'-N-acetyltransferase
VNETQLRFRALHRVDLPLLSDWLAAPHVEQWWREDPDIGAVDAHYGPSIDRIDPTECFIVERGGRPIGFVQRYRLTDDPGWQRTLAVTGAPLDGAGIDYLIGVPELTGRGIGPALIEAFVTDLWSDYPDVPAVIADVDQRNRASWRALEKAGFVRTWSGSLQSDDPSDDGPCHVYVRWRPR